MLYLLKKFLYTIIIMIVAKITKRFTKALISFFLQTPHLTSIECPVVEAAHKISSLFGRTRDFVKDRNELNRQYFVQDLDKVTDLCLKIAPNRHCRFAVRHVSFTFRDTVLREDSALRTDISSDESDDEETFKRIISQK